MLFKEVIDRRVDVPRPTEFCEDKEANLMALLKRLYVGRCIHNAFVVGIDKILVASDVALATPSGGGQIGVMSARFTATVDRYQKGNIVNGCKVEETAGNIMKLAHPHITMTTPTTRTHPKLGLISMSTFPQGLMLPMSIRVITSVPHDHRLVSMGELYLPSACSYRFSPVGEIDASQLEALIDMATKAEADVKALATAQRYQFFEELLYPFVVDREKEIDRTRRHSIINIARNMVDVKDKRIVFDARTHWAVMPFVTVEAAGVDTAPPNLGGAHQMSAHQVAVHLLNDYISHAHLLADMVKRYEPEEVFRAHAPLWAMMNQAKT